MGWCETSRRGDLFLGLFLYKMELGERLGLREWSRWAVEWGQRGGGRDGHGCASEWRGMRSPLARVVEEERRVGERGGVGW